MDDNLRRRFRIYIHILPASSPLFFFLNVPARGSVSASITLLAMPRTRSIFVRCHRVYSYTRYNL
jgi:hypothetical protein